MKKAACGRSGRELTVTTLPPVMIKCAAIGGKRRAATNVTVTKNGQVLSGASTEMCVTKIGTRTDARRMRDVTGIRIVSGEATAKSVTGTIVAPDLLGAVTSATRSKIKILTRKDAAKAEFVTRLTAAVGKKNLKIGPSLDLVSPKVMT
jgi:hypothetical protein